MYQSTNPLMDLATDERLLLEKIIGTVNRKIDLYSEEGFGRLALVANDSSTEEEKAEKSIQLDKEVEELALANDVLEVLMHEEDGVWRELHLHIPRDWHNEWAIPLDLFNKGIEKAIHLLKWHQVQPYIQLNELSAHRYKKQIQLLEQIKAFRNQEENEH